MLSAVISTGQMKIQKNALKIRTKLEAALN